MNLKEFTDPPRQCRPAPVWCWNDSIEPSEIETRVRDLKRKGFGGFVIHAGPGLRTRYLGDEWMRAVRRGVETARELEMEAWLSDEDRGPSGFAGGLAPEGHDARHARMLVWTPDAASAGDAALSRAVAYVRKLPGGGFETLAERPVDLTNVGVFFERSVEKGDARFNGGLYPDLLDPDAAAGFIDATHERYSKLFRYDFGRFMPGIFTDGPTVDGDSFSAPDGTNGMIVFPWTAGFAGYFETIHGYPLMGNLHHLIDGADEGFKVRHDFWRTVGERFIEAFLIPVAEWCKTHELLFAGRFPTEGAFFRTIRSGGPGMSRFEHVDIPGVAHPGDTHGKFLAAKEAASAANQLGKERVFSGIYGGAEESLTFAEMKRLADIQAALGATFFQPRFSPQSLRGDAKRGSSPSLSPHQPWWEHARVLTDYLARISWAVSRGKSAADVLVLHPMLSACGAFDPGADNGGGRLIATELSFREIVDELVSRHMGFDLGDERILIAHGKMRRGGLDVGHSRYKAVVLPAADTWLSSTVDLLEKITCPVFIVGDIPGRVSGAPDDRIRRLAEKKNVTNLPDDPEALAGALSAKIGRRVTVTLPGGAPARNVLLNHRVEAGANLLFLANTADEPVEATLSVEALGGVAELDPLTGRAWRYASEYADGRTVIAASLAARGSRIFLVDQTQTSAENAKIIIPGEETLTIEGPYSFRRLHENMLVLDRCALEIDGHTAIEHASAEDARRALRKATGISEYEGMQPWVLERENVRTRTNRTVLAWEFTVRDIPERLELVMECADRFKVEVNGHEVEPSAGKWHIDRKFPVFTITEHVAAGRNVIRAVTDYLWDTDIENLYLAGDFAVGPADEGFPVVREPETLGLGSWTGPGYPFYHGSIVYRLGFELGRIGSARWEIDLSGARGTVFHVSANGTVVGAVPFPPYRGDITSALKRGANEVEIEVMGSIGNLLGTGPATYGFIEPPKLIRIG